MTHPVVADVTARIAERSAEQRRTYLERMAAPAENGPARGRLACANLAHGFAASDTRDKSALRRIVKPTSRSCRPTTTSSRRTSRSRATPRGSSRPCSPLPAARFCPTGGITPTNVAEYLKTPNVGCVGGSWLTPADAIDRHDWAKISSMAAVAAELAKAASAATSS